jgi:uncharacterized coiled-coil protein SlyX
MKEGEQTYMRLTKLLAVLLLAPTLMWAQSSTGSTSTSGDTPNVSEQINKLSDAIAAQQAQIAAQQDQMKKQQQDLEKLRKQLAEQKAATNAPHIENASLNTSAAPTATTQNPPGGPQQPEAQGSGKTSPLSFRIGSAEFTPGGFLDFTNVFRSTNTGSIVSTGFAGIPFSNTAQGHLTELRTTSQYSRISLKAASKVLGGDVTGYFEMDFNGNDPANVFVSSQNHTMRVRLAYMEYKRGPIQLIGGQTWGWLTPNRVGLGTANPDMMITNNSDANINVGLAYSRPSALHIVLRPNSHFGWGVGIETQQQFVGGGVTFPNQFAGTLAAITDAGATPGAPSLHPGILTKLAFDSNPTGRNFHFEIAAIANSVKVALPVLGAAGTPVAGAFTTQTKTGGGIQPAFVLGLSKKFRVVGNAFFSNGGGRQIIGLGPDFVVRPDGNISLVHADTGMFGAEANVTSNTLVAVYYGAAYFGRNTFLDTTVGGGKFVGYGGPGSANTNNRAIQEPTLDIQHTFWKSPQWGALGLNLQSSYLTRAPWNTVGGPKNAHLFQQYIVLRYILP